MILMFLHKTGWFWNLLNLQLLEKVVNFRNLYWYSWKSFAEASIQTRIDESYLVDLRRQEQSWWSVIVWSREVKEKIWKQKWTAREDLLRKSWEFETGVGSSEVQTNIRFSSLFAAGDVSRRETSATQWQKFHTDDADQCLHNKSGSYGVPNINLSNFTCPLVDFGKVLCSSANKLQRNSNASSREDYIPQILTVLLEIHHVYIWPLCPFVSCLSSVNNS